LAKIISRGYSTLLERAIVDFGADNAFGHVQQKLKEHYGIELAASAAQRITEAHAARAHAYEAACLKEVDESLASSDVVITQTDGGMVPTVRVAAPKEGEVITDNRKNKILEWREAKLSLAHIMGATKPIFAGTFGDPYEAGEQLYYSAKQAGFTSTTKVHAVGDGAPWIADQVNQQFGAQGTYLIDFYHLCEYLSAAAKIIAPNNTTQWMDEQKTRMKSNAKSSVLEELLPYIESPEKVDQDAPIRACYRYITNRPEQFKYMEAIAAELPIGSGEVESSHRYIVQKRLKLPGAWWKIDNAQHMLSLRIMRFNGRWDAYWDKVMKQAA
jgi:hypothetical protein